MRGHPQVERVLGPAVQVERAQPLQAAGRSVVVEAQRAVAVGGRRGGVDEPHLARRAPAPQPQRQLDIGRPGGSPSLAVVSLTAPRWNSISSGGWPARKSSSSSGGSSRDGGCLARLRHLPFAAQPVDHHRLVAARNQRGVQVRADEAGAAGDHDHAARVIRASSAHGSPAQTGDTTWPNGHAFFDDLAGVAGGALSALAGHARGGRGDGPRPDRRGAPPAGPGPPRGTRRAGRSWPPTPAPARRRRRRGWRRWRPGWRRWRLPSPPLPPARRKARLRARLRARPRARRQMRRRRRRPRATCPRVNLPPCEAAMASEICRPTAMKAPCGAA